MKNFILKNIFLIILVLGITSVKAFSQTKEILLKKFIKELVVKETPFTFINNKHVLNKKNSSSLNEEKITFLEKKYNPFIPKFLKKRRYKVNTFQCNGKFLLAEKENFYFIMYIYSWTSSMNEKTDFFILYTINKKGKIINNLVFDASLIKFNISKQLSIHSAGTGSVASFSISDKGKIKQIYSGHALRLNFQ
jgi:hypothetical protein